MYSGGISIAGSIDKKISAMTTITYNLARSMFGVEVAATRTGNPPTLNKRQEKFKGIRKDIKNLTIEYKKVREEK